MKRRMVCLGLVTAVGLGVTACAPGGERLPDRLEEIRPTQVLPSPTAAAPGGFQQVAGDHFTLSIPSGWAEAPVGNSPMQKVYKAAANERMLLGIVVEKQPRSGVIEQSKVTEVGLRSRGGTGITRSEVAWPDAERAIILDWRQKAGGPQAPELRYRQLMIEVNPSLLVTVVGAAPVDDFEESGILAAIETFRAKA
ncbi:MAG: hypothetical protein QM708_04605 [Propioniciclava sp.]|uniref:hypothetical protein n=1 Tax=Propioniciclava sp. TaxID=2038686 RepID=UPI0039E54242